MSHRHYPVFASRGTAVGAEVCCLDIGLRHKSHWVSNYRGACSIREFDSLIFSIIVIVLSCFYMLYLQKTYQNNRFYRTCCNSLFSLPPPGILSPGTLYPGVKCPPPQKKKNISYLFFFYNFCSATYFIAFKNDLCVCVYVCVCVCEIYYERTK